MKIFCMCKFYTIQVKEEFSSEKNLILLILNSTLFSGCLGYPHKVGQIVIQPFRLFLG